jgi:hypothetical protein
LTCLGAKKPGGLEGNEIPIPNPSELTQKRGEATNISPANEYTLASEALTWIPDCDCPEEISPRRDLTSRSKINIVSVLGASLGIPKWHSYHPCVNYVTEVVATLINDQVQFSHKFRALFHVEVVCTYDLNTKKGCQPHG